MTSRSEAMDNLPSISGVSHRWVSAGPLDVHVACAGSAGAAADRVPVVLVHGWALIGIGCVVARDDQNPRCAKSVPRGTETAQHSADTVETKSR